MRRCASLPIRLIRPHSFASSLQNQYSQPAGAESGRGPMRDVRRFYIAVVYILSQYCGVKRVSKWRGGYSGETSIFFFQAEDGIRDRDVTGVQTCALPI